MGAAGGTAPCPREARGDKPVALGPRACHCRAQLRWPGSGRRSPLAGSWSRPAQCSALVLPAAIAAFHRTGAVVAVSCFAALTGPIAWQPDISQLAAFSIAAAILFFARLGWKGLIASAAVAGVAIAVCLSRPDPLAPVAHVEGVPRPRLVAVSCSGRRHGGQPWLRRAEPADCLVCQSALSYERGSPWPPIC